MKRRKQFFLMTLAAGTIALVSANLIWAQSASHARIVRLSFVEGNVTLQRPDVSQWAEAPANTPLQEGFKLSTGDSSFAEVEFENGGTVRLGQMSLLDLSELELTAGGGKVNHLQLEQGYATFHARMESGEDSFEVSTPMVIAAPRGSAMFRVDIDQDAERIEVFRGALEVTGNPGSWTLEKNAVLELHPGADEPATVSQGITKDDWDKWVDDRESLLASVESGPPPNDEAANPPRVLCGWSDLGQYGTWSYVPGWGYGWIPSVASGWAPYTMGQWCWYPGWGWTWIPYESWGWVPYHYGDWDFFDDVGWVWFPGSFSTWSPAPVTWYSGPGWVGWRPRLHPIHGSPMPRPCGRGRACGGAVVSTHSFRHGGIVNSTTALARDPASGTEVQQPKPQPTAAAMLPGPAVKGPAVNNPMRPLPRGTATVQVAPARDGNPLQGKVAGSGAAAPASRPHSGVTMTGTGIAYDPQQGAYVNKPSPEPTEEAASAPQGASGFTVSPARNSEVSPAGVQTLTPPATGIVGRPQSAPATSSASAEKPGPAAGVAIPRTPAGPRGGTLHISRDGSAGPSAPAVKGPASSGGASAPAVKASPSAGGSSGSHMGGGGGEGRAGGGGGMSGGGGHSGGGGAAGSSRH